MTKRFFSEVKEKLKLLVIDNSDEIDNLDVNTLEVIAMAPMVLECPDAECKLGSMAPSSRPQSWKQEWPWRC